MKPVLPADGELAGHVNLQVPLVLVARLPIAPDRVRGARQGGRAAVSDRGRQVPAGAPSSVITVEKSVVP